MSNQWFNGNGQRIHLFGLLALLLACLPLAPAASAQTSVSSNRWLMLVETSKYTRSQSNEVAYMAGAVIIGGIRGQARAGDTLGLWTFNDDLHEARFPLQELGPDYNRRVGQRVRDFLLAQRFENKGRLSKALPGVLDLIKESDFITVLILSTGNEKVSGTPFDEKINSAFQQVRKQVKQKNTIVATVLRGRQGLITDYMVMLPAQGLDLPPLPPEQVATNRVAVEKKPTPAKAPVVVAPLIISGTKVLSAPITNEVPGEIQKP